VIVCFRAINFGKTAFSREMPFFATVEIFLFFLWGRSFLKSLLLEAFLFFSEDGIGFLIYLVGVPLFLLSLKVIRFVIVLIFLSPFSKIVVEARNYRD
jgi:hypothetical protein